MKGNFVLASYNYKAKSSAGEIITGKFGASDESMVVNMLRSKGYFPVEISEDNVMNKNIKLSFLDKVTIKDLAILCRQFSTMIDAGVSILACLDMLRKQTENKKLAEILVKVYDEVQKGKSLSKALAGFPKDFPVIFISMVEVGEVSGTLDVVLGKLTMTFEKERKIQQKVQTAMMYPMTIGGIAVIVVIFLLTFIFPNFVGMFLTMGGGADLMPGPTKVVLFISGLFKNLFFDIGLIGFIAAFVFMLNKYKKTENGKFVIDNFMLKIPLINSNIRKIMASRFTRTLSALLNSGIPLIQALEVVEKVVDNSVVSRGLMKVREEIRRGSNLTTPIESLNIFPPMVVHMMSVGEESGSLDSIMEKVADFYDEELDTSISKLIAMLEPIMLMVLACIIGFIVVSMIMPIFTMYNNV
jgi:type IV pilus assembly protein PilC